MSGFDTKTSVQIKSSEVGLLVWRAAEIQEEGKVEMEGHRRSTLAAENNICV